MFQKERFSVKLNSVQLMQMKRLQIAYNNTFVLQGLFNCDSSHKHQLFHIDVNGKVLKGISENHQAGNFEWKVISPQQMIIIAKRDENIIATVVNLRDYSTHEVQLERKCSQSCKIDHRSNLWKIQYLYYFPETQFIAIEQGYHKEAKIMFYDYKKMKYQKNIEPLSQYCFQGQYLMVKQTDNYSQIVVWWQQYGFVKWMTFLNSEGQINTFKNINFISKVNYCFQSIYLDIFKIEQNNYLCQVDLYDSSYEHIICEHIFIDVQKEGKIDIKQTQFLIEQIEGPERTLESLKFAWVFYSLPSINKKACPTYYFDRTTQNCIRIDHQQTAVVYFNQQFSFPKWNQNIVIRAQLTYQRQLLVSITTMFSRFTVKEVSMDMLLHINEDFDDDLLQDAIELLSE